MINQCARCGDVSELEVDKRATICPRCGNIDYVLEVQNGKIDLEDLFGRIDRVLGRNKDGKIGS